MCTLTSSINSVNVYIKMGGNQRPRDTNESSRFIATFLLLGVWGIWLPLELMQCTETVSIQHQFVQTEKAKNIISGVELTTYASCLEQWWALSHQLPYCWALWMKTFTTSNSNLMHFSYFPVCLSCSLLSSWCRRISSISCSNYILPHLSLYCAANLKK